MGTSFRTPPGLEKLQEHDVQGEDIAKSGSVNFDCEAVGAQDIFTMTTAPPSPGGTSDSCDDVASERSAGNTGARLKDIGYSPGRLLLEEVGSTSEERFAPQVLNLSVALDTENL